MQQHFMFHNKNPKLQWYVTWSSQILQQIYRQTRHTTYFTNKPVTMIKRWKPWATSPNNKLSIQPTAYTCITFTLNVTKNNFTLYHRTCQNVFFCLLQSCNQNTGVLMRTEWLYICLVHADVLKKKHIGTIFLIGFRKGRNKWNYLAANI